MNKDLVIFIFALIVFLFILTDIATHFVDYVFLFGNRGKEQIGSLVYDKV